MFALTLLFVSTQSSAGVVFGGAMSSAMSGRLVPGLHTGLMFESFAINIYSSGVRSAIYYHNAYQLSVMRLWDPGKFLWGKWTGGFGLGTYLGIKNYRESPASASRRHYDICAGPSGRVQWNFAGPVFIAMEIMFGLRNLWPHLLLSFQDMANLSMGLRL